MANGDAYLRAVEWKAGHAPSERSYPYHLPAVRQVAKLKFHPAVTYIVGENGSGKSTILEAIAVAWGFNPEGGTRNFAFSTWESHSPLHDHIRLVRSPRQAKDGFFFRAESYYNLATHIEELDREPAGAPPIIQSYGGISLHHQSHGESFFATFLHRFRGNSLYILDEPEAALSPSRQMSMLSRMHQLVQQGAQFIIATHSPILMAYPDSILYDLGENGIEVKKLEETEHFLITKEFVNNRQRMLRELLE
ncbi:MAG: family ATPase [Paenibacillaceae bacterium]|nr:family ATPase [Paenibacillaceae bacterium]